MELMGPSRFYEGIIQGILPEFQQKKPQANTKRVILNSILSLLFSCFLRKLSIIGIHSPAVTSI